MVLIFDLDQTLIDTSSCEMFRRNRDWSSVYDCIKNFGLYNGVQTVLAYLASNNFPYVIVTSSPTAYATKVCKYWDFHPSSIIGYHDTVKKKPHPDPMLLALSRMNIHAEHAISFGDRDIDILSSNLAKIKSVACLWGCVDEVALMGASPSFIIKSPLEIITLAKANFRFS